MTSTRRAGADDLRLLGVSSDPPVQTGEVLLYTKAGSSGTSVLCARGDDGFVYKVTPGNVFAPPEQWFQDKVPAGLTDSPLATRVTQNFTTIQMIRPGWIVGLGTRLTQPITAGQLIVSITLNGVNVLGMGLSAGGNPSGGSVVQDVGVEQYQAGDVLGISINTTLTLAPTTSDLIAWMQLYEQIE